MKNFLKRVLVLYKRSAYKIYFLEKDSSLSKRHNPVAKNEIARFEKAHDQHYQSLEVINKTLLTYGVRFKESYRGHNIDYSQFDFIITVGGDGTFLEASRHLKNQIIIGVNSAPEFSVGRFCIATAKTFDKVLLDIKSNKISPRYLNRLRARIEGEESPIDFLNDILICHSNPANLSRYYLQINSKWEEQRSSGIWISTAVGSSGAIFSAGGKKLIATDKRFQYMPRELYRGSGIKYNLTGGLMQNSGEIQFTSLMRKGMVFVDGAHVHHPFAYGTRITINTSPFPIRTFSLK